MAFICVDCWAKLSTQGFPGFSFSRGPCEYCYTTRPCSDVPSSYIACASDKLRQPTQYEQSGPTVKTLEQSVVEAETVLARMVESFSALGFQADEIERALAPQRAWLAKVNEDLAAKVRDEAVKQAFIAYLEQNPQQRFWQAVRNFSPWHYIYGSDVLTSDPDVYKNTFNLEGEQAMRYER
jgi:hypothetical protein